MKELARLKLERDELIRWIERCETARTADRVDYEQQINNLELQIEELEAPSFTEEDAAVAEKMLESDYEDELCERLEWIVGADYESAHIEAENILLECLRFNGYHKLANAYEDAAEKIGFHYA